MNATQRKHLAEIKEDLTLQVGKLSLIRDAECDKYNSIYQKGQRRITEMVLDHLDNIISHTSEAIAELEEIETP